MTSDQKPEGKYSEKLPPEDDGGDLMTVDDFRACCKDGLFIDYDGMGHPVKGKWMMTDVAIVPSKLGQIPEDATHIMWFNR